MANGINSGYDFSYNAYTSSSQVFNYKQAQMETASLLSSYNTGSSSSGASVAGLKASTANFLTGYTNSMNSLYQSASVFAGGGINDMLYDKNGEITEDTIEKTVQAVQDMVDQYNKSLSYLNDNASRGSGVAAQIGRMASDPMAAQKMDMVGLSVNKDATLKLDADFLKDALTSAAEKASGDSRLSGELDLLKDVIGGRNGLAGNIQNRASAGMNVNSSKLVGNDIAQIQQQQSNASSALMGFDAGSYGSFNRAGAYFFSNQAAVGMMMNMSL